MDIMELGAIGELVGGLAVVASLIFVGLQVRQNNRLVSNTVAKAAREGTSKMFQTLSADPETTYFYLDGLARDYTDARERIRFDLLLAQVLRGAEGMYLNYVDGDLSREVFESYRRNLAPVFGQPGGLASWRRQRAMFTDRFTAYVDRYIVSHSDAER